MPRMTTEKRIELLMKKTNKTGSIVNEELGHCWEWQGQKKEGYGIYSNDSVHRLSYKLHVGDIPFGSIVRHKCDNRSCLNPAHLELGTIQDNIKDKIARGRSRGGHRRGENSTNVKLNVDQVREIRENPYGCILECQAHRFGCSTSQISRIMQNDRWSELVEQETEDLLFWKRSIKSKQVVVESLGECWETSRERQLISYRNKHMLAHRIAYTISKGQIDEGMIVRHKCDNDKCINPEHLELGTHQDNMNDRRIRGRICKGEKHHSAVLTSLSAMEIFNLQGKETMTSVAKRFGITKQCVSRIWKRKSWKSIHEQQTQEVAVPTTPD